MHKVLHFQSPPKHGSKASTASQSTGCLGFGFGKQILDGMPTLKQWHVRPSVYADSIWRYTVQQDLCKLVVYSMLHAQHYNITHYSTNPKPNKSAVHNLFFRCGPCNMVFRSPEARPLQTVVITYWWSATSPRSKKVRHQTCNAPQTF